MPRQSPLHARTAALNESFLWKEWSGFAAVRAYEPHSEQEYHALRHTAGLMDGSPLIKYDLTGPDAARLLSRVFTRDIGKLARGQVAYSAMADERGHCLDDGTVARIGEQHYRMGSSERWMHWLRRWGRDLDVQVEDTTDRIALLALQGPKARRILKPLVEWDMDKLRFFRIRRTRLAGIDVWVSRTGYTGDLGYEVWVDADQACAVWDAVMEEGRPVGLLPNGLDALDVTRIEAGYVLQGIDYVTAKSCLVPSRKSTPSEAGLGWTVDLDRDGFVGQQALRSEKPAWALVGVEFDWAALERLYDEYGLPPHLAPVACRDAVPIYSPDSGRQIDQITSTTWSPLLKKYIAIGQVYSAYGNPGQALSIEHTVDFHRRRLPATVVQRPFFDPERKRSNP